MNFTGLTDEFDSKIPCVLSDVRKILHEKYRVEWKNDLVNYPKLRTYRLIRSEFECEKYVDINLNLNEQSVLAQFRCGILLLRIETGRFVGEAEQDRLCKLCHENCVENEIHFLMSCNFYNEIRAQYFHDIDNFLILSTHEQLKYLLNLHPRKTAKFLSQAFLMRKHFLYIDNQT